MSVVTCPLCHHGEVQVDVQPREPDVGIAVAYITETYPCSYCGDSPVVTRYHDEMMDELVTRMTGV